MKFRCSICGDEYEEEEMTTDDVCNYCSTTIIHDKFEGHQLF